MAAKGAGLLQMAQLAGTQLLRGQLPPDYLLKDLISKGLSYGILAGSMLVKVPQLLNVLRARSAQGLNPVSFELETVALLIATTYGFVMGLPFTAFGEVLALLLQNVALLFIVYHFQRRSLARSAALVALLAGWGGYAGSGVLGRGAVARLYDATNLIMVAARVPQIAQNFAARSTGQLSAVTYGLNTAGAAARIFTSMQEGAGAAMVRGAAISTVLNAIMVAQIAVYGSGGRGGGGKGRPRRTSPRKRSKAA